MSTSIILLEQNVNANDVDIMVFESSVLFPQVWGGIDDMVPILLSKNIRSKTTLKNLSLFCQKECFFSSGVNYICA